MRPDSPVSVLELPIPSLAAEPSRVSRELHGPGSSVPERTQTILFAEDDDDLRRVMTCLLESRNSTLSHVRTPMLPLKLSGNFTRSTC